MFYNKFSPDKQKGIFLTNSFTFIFSFDFLFHCFELNMDFEEDEEIEEFLNSLPPEILDKIQLSGFGDHGREQSITNLPFAISQCILGVLESLIPLFLKSIGATAIQFTINSKFGSKLSECGNYY